MQEDILLAAEIQAFTVGTSMKMRCTLSVCCVSICIILKALIPLHLTSGLTAANCQEYALEDVVAVSRSNCVYCSQSLCLIYSEEIYVMGWALFSSFWSRNLQNLTRCCLSRMCSATWALQHCWQPCMFSTDPCFLLLCPHYTHTPGLPLWTDGCF